MAADLNKDVVRGFITEVLIGGQFDRIDEFLAPNGVDLAGFKGMLPGLAAVLPERQFDIEELIAEGNAVVARYTSEMRDRNGRTISVRGLTYYRLVNGRIVEDDPVSTPDLLQELGIQVPAQTAL